MSEKQDNKGKPSDSQDVILDLNFVPQWARKPPGENHYREHNTSEREPRDHKRDRKPRRSPSGGDNKRSYNQERQERTDRPPRRNIYREPPKELPLKISFLPEQKFLASLVRQIHHSRRAFPLMDLANLLLENAEAYLVKVEVERTASNFNLHQCKYCKAVAETEEMIVQHIQSKHLSDYYDAKEVETEAPSGVFVCVARCRKSGVLLGPPNHHSYLDNLTTLHQKRFAHLSMDDFKRQIETVRDEELIEQWRQESCKKTLYTPKDNPEAEPVELTRAEIEFKKKTTEMYEQTQRAIIPSKIAQNLEDQNITSSIRRVWNKESHFPITLSFAMRAAFRHMHLHIFKAGKINFVTHIKPNAIKPEDTIESICEVLLYLKDHPGSTRQQLVEELRPSAQPESEEANNILKPLTWLIERGHIIEFFNGTLSVPLK